MTHLPPPDLPPFEEDPDQPVVMMLAPQREPVTLADLASTISWWLIANIIGCAIAAIPVSYLWSALELFETVPTINWVQAFALILLVRTLALVVRI